MSDTETADIAPDTAETTETVDTTEAEDSTTPDATVDTTETDDSAQESDQDDADTFSRAYVERLRDESAKLRVRAQRADELAHRLHRALVEQTGKLADPADLEFDPQADTDLFDNPDALNAAIDGLIAAKPHLRSRTPRGDVGQGIRGRAEEPTNLLGILKSFV
jgi:hypothetical protein